MKRFAHFISVAGVLTLGAAVVPSFARTDAAATTQPSDQGRTEGTHGAGKLIENALDEVELRPDQKDAVEAMKARAKERQAPVKAATREFVKVLADQIESGKIDRCALAPKTEAIASATAQAHPGDRGDFERLHSILDPDQRKAFVDALKRQWDSMEKMHEPSALADKIATKLDLSGDQKASLEKILTGLHEVREAEPWHAKHRERWAKILDAFESDHFVLDEVAPMGDVAADTTARVERALWAGEAILPVLTPDQRKAIADKLRDWASKTGSESGDVSPTMSPSAELE